MITLVLADLRSRRRSLAALGGGCFMFLVVLAGTYSAFGGAEGFGKTLGSGSGAKLVAAFSGSSSGDIFTPAHYLAYGFGHPLFLVLTLSVAISLGVGAVAGDIETGRAELLFTAPIRRTAILDARLAGWAIAQGAVLACAVAGALVGSQLSADMAGVSVAVPFLVALQFCSLVFVVAAVAFAASACAPSRGTALGVTVGVVAGSYMLNLVALLWEPLAFVRHLNPFGYYSPTAVTGHLAWGDAAVLVVSGIVLLAVARHRLRTRDLA